MKENNILNIDLNQEMRESYLQYSMSVIVGRALPDVRDGLKPVHRRILFAMKSLKNTHDKPYKKSARIVGDVIGKYHPHGDQAVYDTIVRMAQHFSMRHTLVDGQGNFGSIDGDAPAAARYTEVRMTALAEELLTDIDKKTVPYVWNYDDSLLMPQVLPACFPNLLINGSEGIAVGMASRIPPHNLGEIISACQSLIDNKDLSDEKLHEIVPGPDFPTAGIIRSRAGLVSAYTTGKGIITVQAKVEVKESEKAPTKLIVHELPFQVNKARLIESIAGLVKDKKIEGISDIRDESSRQGLRVVIVLKRRENADVILNQLFKHSQLRVRFGIIFLALNAQGKPVLFSLRRMLQAFIDHRFLVLTKRLHFDLQVAKAKIHILEGLSKALEHIEEIIQIIRQAKDAPKAKIQLQEKFALSKKQTQAILDMKLQRLTGLERQKIKADLEQWRKEALKLEHILSSEQEIFTLIKTQLDEIKTRFATNRKTYIDLSVDDDIVETKQLIPKENVLVALNMDGEIKQISLEEYRLQKRGGVGIKGSQTTGALVRQSLCVNTHSTLLVLTDRGRLCWLEVFRIPRMGRIAKGRSIRNLVQLQKDEKVQMIFPIDIELAEDSSKSLCLITKNGIFKKTLLKAYSRPRRGGVITLDVKEDDQLMSACIGDEGEDILVLTKKGFSIRFPVKSVRALGRKARGVKGMTLQKDDEVIFMKNIADDSNQYFFSVTRNGFGKRTKLLEYRSQIRGGKGCIAHRATDKTGVVVAGEVVREKEELLVMTTVGQSIRFACQEVSVVGRVSQGVRLMKLKSNEGIRSISLIQ